MGSVPENTTSGLSAMDDEIEDESITKAVIEVVVSNIIILATLFGNILTIVAIVKEDSLKKVGNSFIASLAVADLLVGVLVLPLRIVNSLTPWIMGNDIVCIIALGNDWWFCGASVFNIVCISIDRYIAISDPLHYKMRMTCKFAALLIGITWATSAAIAYVPVIVSWFINVNQSQAELHCGIFSDYTAFIPSLVVLFVPVIPMVICYSIIFCIVQRRAAQVNEMMQMAENANNEHNDGNNEVQIFMRRSTKAAKTLSIVTGVFFLCWLLFFIGMYCSEIYIFIEELLGKYSLFLHFSLSPSLSLSRFLLLCVYLLV